jgi:hypothetical protein
MVGTSQTIERAIALLPDLEQVALRLENEPADVLERAFPAEEKVRTRAIVGEGEVQKQVSAADDALRVRTIEEGRNGLRKILDYGHEAPLSAAETVGTEAIILMTGRPAILIQDGKFFPPPAEWAKLEDRRAAIEQVLPSVGRIEVTGHPEYEWIGTGFLVADEVCMTNRHVAKEFCRHEGGGTWTFEPGMTSRIDYVEELGAPVGAEFALEDVIGIHDSLDMGLFRVSRNGPQDVQAPAALPLAAAAPDRAEPRDVFVVGYPAWDGRRNDPSVMQRIFTNIFDVKRLQPGTLIDHPEPAPLVAHDCSTLGGNSGSCVVDLETCQVLALHFSGRYGQANRAVALWDLQQDPLVAGAGLNFA